MKFDEMTEDQILNEILKAVPEYLNLIKPDGDFNRQVCVEMVVKNLRSMFKRSRGIGYYDRMMVHDIKELDIIIGHFFPMITDRVAAVEMQYKKDQMEAAINKAKAEAIIVPAFEGAGFEVKVGYNKSIQGEGSLDDLVSAVVDLRDAAIRIGGKLFIGRQ